ncbi:MAG TPA: hypothetical protein VGF55_12860 [Gemmataceae bacterium]|jgi:hypothetical protein
MHRLLIVATVISLPAVVILPPVIDRGLNAAEPTTPTPAATRMTERGKLVFSDDLTAKPGPAWRVGKGKWEAVDGALKGSELKADMHGAVMRHAQNFRNAVVQYSFKLDGCRQTTFSVNAAKGHLCRCLINPNGFAVQKDSSDHGATDKPMVLERKAVAIKPGVWHTIVIELQGKEMLACLDGEHVAFGSHEALDKPKANFGLTVAGESASFKDFKMWEAEPSKEWEATKAKLLAARGKAGKK